MTQLPSSGLYRECFEHDSCGFALIAQMDDRASHALVKTAIGALARLTHRGAIAADGKTGDGCGLLMKKPERVLRAKAAELKIKLGPKDQDLYCAGNLFLSPDERRAARAREVLAESCAEHGLKVLGWRELPHRAQEACGAEALKTLPRVEQVFIGAPPRTHKFAFELKLFKARRRAEKILEAEGDKDFYVTHLSCRVIVYKGLVMPAHLPTLYPDLEDPLLESSICVFHQRFSTNTLPQWRLAHPFRFLAHNGEINTIAGNRMWAQARRYKFQCEDLPDIDAIAPLVSMSGSDSQSLDNMLEVLLAGGMDLFAALRALIPPAWQNVESLDPDVRAFYEYNSLQMEPWDGPAGVVLTDGRYAVCATDRNGLRPTRYAITRDRTIVLASEIGVVEMAPEEVVEKGRLRPGQMLAVDTESGALLRPPEIDQMLAARAPYKQWLKRHLRRLEASLHDDPAGLDRLHPESIAVYQKLFLLTQEERNEVLRVLAESGQETVGSMGDDTPFAVLSRQPRSLFDYFRQQFAQVTNPPIDPLREQIVMSLECSLGPERGMFDETPERAARLLVDSPVLSEAKFRNLLALGEDGYPNKVFDLNYEPSLGLKRAIENLCDAAVDAVRAGTVVLVLSDRAIARDKLPIHALLAVGALQHRLIREGLRCDCNLIVETATARDPHHFACLIGYGASCVYPYLAYASLYEMVRTGQIKDKRPEDLAASYRKGINKGLYKIVSKMGISTVSSYRGAQLFEIVGLHDEVVDLCFAGTVSRVEGARFADLEAEAAQLALAAWTPRKPVPPGGLYRYVVGGEFHAFNPDVVNALHKAVRSGDYEDYRVFARLVNERPPTVFRDLFKLAESAAPVPLDEVEPVEAILKRFDSAGMSLGALSPEAHEALAIAMSRLGARSNSGEGGEDPARYGTEKASKIKQVASGRFGVTPAYLVNAEVLQIKIAQGAKPGEGGQLPGHKVDATIARLRYAKPGIGLISPPPHHDIYSIEDLSQLIFDLKQVNPQALVSVKLVSGPGVGTIAAGVAKAYADLITISGYDGGTGASPWSSIRYAGVPWELGLAETHQTLVMNGLRGRVILQTDGGLKTGLDVVKAAILGADSFGFGTAPMVALGCKYLRICHLNSCATGVATQNDILRRKHFLGAPEMAENFFRFVAEDVRGILASLGARTLAELIGRTDLLRIATGESDKQRGLDLTPILSAAGMASDAPQYCVNPNPPHDKGELAERMVRDARPAIEDKTHPQRTFEYTVNNTHRSIGARLSGEIARRHGNLGLADAPITLKLKGVAGQSFGVWNAGGLHLELEGEANDYVGKGMAGGRIVIRPPRGSRCPTNKTVILGNTCLYGATGGTLYAAGVAGERFAVRNSGALAVVEGVGDHGCEYMTGGVVVVLGRVGVNFGAGMTGGFAYVLDERRNFVDRYNHELIDIHRVMAEHMEGHRHYLLGLIRDYADATGSEWGREIIENFRDYVGKFWLAKPKAADIGSLLVAIRAAA